MSLILKLHLPANLLIDAGDRLRECRSCRLRSSATQLATSPWPTTTPHTRSAPTTSTLPYVTLTLFSSNMRPFSCSPTVSTRLSAAANNFSSNSRLWPTNESTSSVPPPFGPGPRPVRDIARRFQATGIRSHKPVVELRRSGSPPSERRCMTRANRSGSISSLSAIVERTAGEVSYAVQSSSASHRLRA